MPRPAVAVDGMIDAMTWAVEALSAGAAITVDGLLQCRFRALEKHEGRIAAVQTTAPASSDEEHEMSDGESVRRLTVCGRCHAVRGGPIGTVDGVTVWQRCDCVPAGGLPAQLRVGDFNTAVELCRACGLVLLQSGSGGRCGSEDPARRRRRRSMTGQAAAWSPSAVTA